MSRSLGMERERETLVAPRVSELPAGEHSGLDTEQLWHTPASPSAGNWLQVTCPTSPVNGPSSGEPEGHWQLAGLSGCVPRETSPSGEATHMLYHRLLPPTEPGTQRPGLGQGWRGLRPGSSSLILQLAEAGSGRPKSLPCPPGNPQQRQRRG